MLRSISGYTMSPRERDIGFFRGYSRAKWIKNLGDIFAFKYFLAYLFTDRSTWLDNDEHHYPIYVRHDFITYVNINQLKIILHRIINSLSNPFFT